MKKLLSLLLCLCLTNAIFAQVKDNEKLIQLGIAYKDFMFRNEPTKGALKDVKSEVSENLKKVADFIVQTISNKNKLLSSDYLSRPDDITLKQIYIVRAINLNVREETQIDNAILIDSLTKSNIPSYELLDNYYDMLFTAIGNKNQPFDLSKTDLTLKNYDLKDDTERGILVLRAISLCGTTIWGYMNIPQPPNYKMALEYIEKFPKINGQKYYQYSNFYFPDFEMNIVKDKGIQSYKSYYLDKFYQVLLSHLICLNKEGGTEKEKNDLLLGSILKEQNLYKYTGYKATLEKIFTK